MRLDKPKRISSPMWWTVFATVVTGIGSEIVSDIVNGQSSPVSVGLVMVSALFFLLSGSALFYRAWSADSARDDFRRKTEDRERRFLWDMHNPDVNPSMVEDEYSQVADSAEIKQWRREKVIVLPEKVHN